jgi:ABC-type nitrate/sulfonate/bicarbonate transport system permease component
MASGIPSARHGLRSRLRRGVLELIVPAAALAGWWIASTGSTSLYFPPLSSIASSFRHVWLFSHFGSDAVPSLEHLAAGLALAGATGVTAGIALGLAPAVADAFAPILEFLRALPSVALVPAALLFLGIGPTMQVSVIASAAVWPVLLTTADGVRGVDPVLTDVARAYRIRGSDRIRMLIRAASPQIVAGLRTALSVAVTMIVFSVMVGSTDGIGFQLLHAQRSFDIADMWASMVFLGVLGYLLNLAFRVFENAALKWHRGMRQTDGRVLR